MKRKTTILSDTELALLRKQLKRSYFIVALIIVSIAFILFILFLAMDEPLVSWKYFVMTLVVGLAFIIGLHLYLSKALRDDIDEKTKYINQYPIEEKQCYEDNEPGLGGLVIRYILKSEGKEFFVDKELYDKAIVGDILEEHITKNKEEFLGYYLCKIAST